LFERRPTFAAAARNATRINLAPLSDVEMARLVSLLLDSAVLPADIQFLILERAEGNPLYAEEFARLLKDRGMLQRRTATIVAGDAAEMPLPDSIQALIAARLDTLAPDRKRLLQHAAVVGKVFWAGAVAAVAVLGRADV